MTSDEVVVPEISQGVVMSDLHVSVKYVNVRFCGLDHRRCSGPFLQSKGRVSA